MRFAFRSSALASIAAIAATNDVRMEELTAVQRQEKLDTFAADFTRKMEAQDVKEGKAAAPAEGAGEDEQETEATGTADTDDEGTEETDTDEETRGSAEETDDDEDEETDADRTAKKDEIDEEETDDEEDEELDEDFKRAAGRANLPTTLDDIPEAARPLVAKRLKELESGFTRAMKDARSYRAEERFRKEHPVDFIAEMLAADPDLEAKVSAELEKRSDETYSESRKIITDDRRKKAAEAVDAQRESETKREARISEVESLTQKAAARYGVPMRVVEAAIANAIITAESGDIDNSDITEIVKGIAKELGTVSRKERIESGKKLVQDKVSDRKNAPKIRPGTGRGTPPAKPGKSKMTLEQKIAATVDKIFPGAD